MTINQEQLFWDLYNAPVEGQVQDILEQYGIAQSPQNWRPYGGNENNFSTVDNQQASPIPALIEKITNGIDSILMRACIESGIDPKSDKAPRSIDKALERFFPEHKNWDLQEPRRQQAERLQILADGPTKETSLIIYDDGEGQTPAAFRDTFLSLHRGNKTDIHFVQGKYNMGGTGALVFCGKHRFQLIGSKRFNNGNQFGFTLVRRHPLTSDEEKKKKATWYEYLIIDGEVPSFFAAPEMDLCLHKRQFSTGSVIKLYSYALPPGSRSDIARDLNPSINEYLFNPALPILIVEKEERSKGRHLERALYGLKRRLEEEDSRYVDEYFSEDINDREMGRLRITCY